MSDQDATARRAELEAAVATAEAEAHAVRLQAQAARERIIQLREQLATRPGKEFSDDGAVRPKTEAAKLHAQLQAAEHPPVPWERREHDAGDRVSAAHRGAQLVCREQRGRAREGP